ncbi:hypothetical protein R1sor_003535 [Riccia sorocarpa]|uniref:Reverse transcriptase domain-containing protein n=1 Tax=Riccia sorocarpa TaxID=122646 RepID=A0ABD3H288_9MARC
MAPPTNATEKDQGNHNIHKPVQDSDTSSGSFSTPLIERQDQTMCGGENEVDSGEATRMTPRLPPATNYQTQQPLEQSNSITPSQAYVFAATRPATTGEGAQQNPRKQDREIKKRKFTGQVAKKRVGPRFSRGQMREGKFLWSRIDRIYTTTFEVDKLEHHDRFWASDHVPISATIQQNNRPGNSLLAPRSAYFKADYTVVNDNFDHLKSHWHNIELEHDDRSDMDKFLLCWTGIRRRIKSLQYEKAQRLAQLPEKENRLQELLRKDTSSLTSEEQSEVGRLMAETRELQAWQNHKWRLACRERYLREGDSASAYFFKTFKRRRARTQVRRIQTEDGRLLETDREIKSEVLRYYADLYSFHEGEVVCENTRQSFLQNISSSLSPEHVLMLDETPSERELTETLYLLPDGKSPGIDGLALKKKGSSALFIALDHEKAYDKLHLDFLWAVMQRMGFSSATINRMRALQMEAETRILLNGDLLPTFQVEKGVRQGCPLSPMLYAIATVPSILAIRKENLSGNIRPVRVTTDVDISVVYLADDMAVYLQLHRDSVFRLFNLLEQFQRATGGKINWQKSKMLIIGQRRDAPIWTSSLPLQLVPPDQSIRYLGASLSTLWNGVDNGASLLEMLNKCAGGYSQEFMSFESRVIALKHGVFASLVYHMMVSKFKAGTIKRIEGTLRRFLWSSNQDGLPKKSLVAWESVVLPESQGGLGVGDFQTFQNALLC